MSTYIDEEKRYSCPHCKSTNVVVNLFCWVDANNHKNVDVDLETDVGDSTKWFCETCECDNFLPHTEARR